ncbi:TIGR02147 family protein [Fibrobacter sp. UWEL]|uniref:TIGR02147 family protein n=1 Tax=Fibrobacter sp. UWEL TaxID=1896209 RepID=UPI00091CDD1F|nr:TIGR02147 family protein [Fibrobacter sp. UWEL]SHK52828.1 TIGR02147 family protein [Fibrobacter sp. UWEL]
MSIALEHLFDYDDFRKFMQDYFEEQKKMRAVFSHRFFAAKAGFSSSSYCLNVIRGRFNLTHKSIEKLAKAMDFEPLQKSYFEALVQYNQADQVNERESAWEQIQQIRKQIEFTHVTTREQAYFSQWYYPILRELAVSSDWNGDYMKLARLVEPQITTDEARDGVKCLLEWGLLQEVPQDDGSVRYEESAQMLDASRIPPMALRKIRREYIQHAIGAVESKPKDERFAAFTTLAMSESSYNYAVEVLEEARKKIISRAANDTEVERVYEMMVVAFPMSKKVKEAKG